MWRPNLGSPAGLSWGMPDVAMNQAGEDFRFVADNHCGGLYFDLFWFHWATQGPHYYVLAHVAWDPYVDVPALMDDYYRRGFGLAAADVRAYWELLERRRMEFVAEEPSRLMLEGLRVMFLGQLRNETAGGIDHGGKDGHGWCRGRKSGEMVLKPGMQRRVLGNRRPEV